MPSARTADIRGSTVTFYLPCPLRTGTRGRIQVHIVTLLFGVFAVLIIIIVLSSLISIQQSDTIRDHVLKGKLISEISDELNTARRNRLTYQINHDENALQANKIAIEKMDQKAESGQTFTWDSDARVLLDELRSSFPYSDSAQRPTSKNITQQRIKTEVI